MTVFQLHAFLTDRINEGKGELQIDTCSDSGRMSGSSHAEEQAGDGDGPVIVIVA